ncbi:MAG: hypothetical protein QME85_08455 [Candidatus Saccharicenans sp.]|nr:hypothetical protein [Candidatus Saccharicenans sp.]
MKIKGIRIYPRQLGDHECPHCGQRLERRPRRLWQKAVSFVLPLRHYECDGCSRRFFAFSPRWNSMSIIEKSLRVLATAAVILAVIVISIRILITGILILSGY